MFDIKEEKDYACDNCESEYSVREHYAELTVSYCPFCGEEVNSTDDEDDS